MMHIDPPKKDEQVEELERQQGIIIKALLAINISIQKNFVPKSIIKINKLKNNYKYNVEITKEYLLIDKEFI
jgi:hypothetical protein